ncbi:MAG: metalloprotease [Aestuariivirga sp.]
MPDFLLSAGRELPFILLLVALLGFRAKVTPRVRLMIKAAPEKIFELLDFTEGQNQRWQKTRVTTTKLDSGANDWRLTFVTPLATGAVNSSQADFRIARREPPFELDIERIGLEGKARDNQLVRMTARFTPRAGGTELDLTYYWGPRALLAQLLARADLWSSAFRIKGVAETGKPDYRSDMLITAAMAIVTGVVTFATFAFAFGPVVAVLLGVALLIHEFGHLLAYRLIGQPWGRLVFLPFLGAVAVPRIGFTGQGQLVFAALMGPGFSVAIAAAAAVYVHAGLPAGEIAVAAGLVACALNLFNLLPVEPLDGGIALRSVLARIAGKYARFGLIAIGVAIAIIGWEIEQVLLLIFGCVAIIANLKPRIIDPGLEPLSRLQVSISAFAFMAIVGAYAVLIRFFIENITAV